LVKILKKRNIYKEERRRKEGEKERRKEGKKRRREDCFLFKKYKEEKKE